MKTSLSWRHIAAGALALGVAALGVAAPASAASPNLVDPAARGSLTIQKCETPEDTGSGGNNRMAAPSDCVPIDGVGFTVYQVNDIDLTTNDGWVDVDDLLTAVGSNPTAPEIAAQGYTVDVIAEELTAGGGLITLTDLDLGLYYVVETAPLPGSSTVAPFLVTLPTTDPDTLDTWLYDVAVYPKNALTSVTKTVDDSEDVQLGDEIEWTITADIPDVETIDGYKIVDPLDDRLDYVDTAVSLTNGATLAATDYTVSFDSGTNTVTVEFTASGLAVLAANAAAQVEAVITTTVNTVGEIPNTALLYPNLPSFDIEPGEPGGPVETPTVETRWGNFTLEKVNETGAPLTGAVFSVYLTEDDALANTNPVNFGTAASPLYEITSDASGLVSFERLRYSDFADGVTVAPGDAGYQTYWLAEVAAPSGYELLASPISFEVTAASTDLTTLLPDLEVTNVPNNGGFALPNTGGAGTTLFWVGGGLLLAGALFLAVYSRRKAKADTSA